MINKLKRIGSVLIMLLLFVTTLSIQVMAATGTVNGLSIATSGSTGKITIGTNSATLTVEKSWSIGGGTAEDTFRFTNPSTNTRDLKISFDYSFEGTSKSISGVTEDTGSKCAVTLNPGGSFSVSVKATAGKFSSAKSTFSITNLSVVEVIDSAQVTVAYDASLGAVTVDGTAVEASSVVTVPNTGSTFAAKNADNASFLAWIDASGKIVSREKNYVCTPTEAEMTLKAVFATNTPWFYVDNNDYLAEGWEEAMKHAGTVALANNATLPAGNYSVPSEVTLLIPYDNGLTCSVDKPVSVVPAKTEADPTAYRTLTMETGAHITVNGTMTVPAAVRAGDTTLAYAGGMVKGTYGHVAMNSGSSITVKSGAKLSTFGYITGSGSIVAESGATVYESFQIMRFRGGSATASMATSKKVFPISQYYAQNIEVPLTLYSGASEVAYVSLYMSSDFIESSVKYIGQSGCLFNLTSGYLVKEYDKANDRQQIDFYGDLTVSKVSINIQYIIDYNINSQNFVMPITSNMTVDIHDGATVNIGANMSMLPGAEINIHKGGKLEISSGKSLYLYDLAEWSGKGYVFGSSDMAALKFTPNRTKTRTAADLKNAQIVVGGTLDASAGKLYTSTTGAAIKGNDGGQVLITHAGAATDRQATQSGTDVTYHDVAMNSAYLQNGDNDYMVTATDTYTYSNGVWNCTNHSYDEGVETTPATCTTDGEKVLTCSVCGETKTEVIPATGHQNTEVINAKEPNCTEAGYTGDTYCNDCKTTIETGSEIAMTAHNYQTVSGKAATCTETGLTDGSQCTVCKGWEIEQSVIPVTNHANKYAGEAKAATCTEAGNTAGEYCPDCETWVVEQETIPATGHTAGEAVRENEVAATCYAEGSYDNVVYCSICNAELSRNTIAVEKVAHDYKTVVTEPTCTDKGYTTYTCSVCGDSYVADEVAALGHTPGETVVENNVPSDYNNAGSYENVVYCTVCNVELSRNKVTVPMLQGVASVNGTNYGSLDEAVKADGDVIIILQDIILDTVVDATGKTIDFNGKTIAGTVLGTLKLNGGTLVTAEGYKMAGPDADYYETTDAVFTMDAAMNINVLSGTMTLVPNEWWTMPNQTLTISQDATFVIPTGKTMQVQGTVIVEGTVTVNGKVNLHNANATVTAAEGLNVTTTAGDKVWYTNGKYMVHNHTAAEAVVKNNVAPDCTNAGSYDNVIYCSVCGDELSREKVTVGALGHTAGEAEIENDVKPTCTTDGSYDTVVYCTVCDAELSRVTTIVKTEGHAWVDADCDTPKTCSACGATEGKPTGEHTYENGVCTGCGEKEPASTIDITVERVGATKNDYGAVVTAPDGGWKEGTNTFYVDCEQACVVVVSYDKGVSYERLPATADGSRYKFTVENVTVDTLLKVLLNGDINGDGKVYSSDITQLSAIYAEKRTPNALYSAVIDVNFDGELKPSDITRVSVAFAGKRQLSWTK